MGVVARLKEGEADLGMVLEPTLERQEVVDFSTRFSKATQFSHQLLFFYIKKKTQQLCAQTGDN